MNGCFRILIFLFVANVVLSTPIIHRDVDVFPMKEIKDEKITKHRWEMVPDGSGRMHLVDLENYEVDKAEPFFDASIDVFFLLFTQRNPTVGERIEFNLDSLRSSQFNPYKATRFVIHGWNNEYLSDVNLKITAGYLDRSDFNVIVVDWGKGSKTIDYITARNRINDVAQVVARSIDFLVSNGIVNMLDISVIGHSLGGHTAGITGKRVTTGKIQTIIALDPAGPLFNVNDRNGRVTEDDGVYVEIIHTNGGNLGYGEPIGHADFYPNGGSSQPGCGVDLVGTCAHGRAYEFFSESLKVNNGFVANRCLTYNEVKNKRCTIQSSGHLMGGEPPNNNLRGIFLLATNSQAPFAKF